jgi:hypothetical protein
VRIQKQINFFKRSPEANRERARGEISFSPSEKRFPITAVLVGCAALMLVGVICIIFIANRIWDSIPDEVFELMKEVQSVQVELEKRYPHQKLTVINASINRQVYLEIEFINSPYSELGDTQKREKAREIAAAAYSLYSMRDELDGVIVVYRIERIYFFVVNYKSVEDFSFSSAELGKEYQSDSY